MANRFEGRGNLGAAPELKRVTVDGAERDVAELRIYFDRSIPTEDAGFEDRGGFWLSASLWGERAEHVASVLTKGARVHVVGTLVRDAWTDRESGEPRERLALVLDQVSLDLRRIEAVVTRPAPAR